MSRQRIASDIVETGKRLYNREFVASNDGNISVRMSHDRVMTTPTGVSKGFMSPEELVVTDMHGNVIEGKKRPSSELKMHLGIYKVRKEVKAVVHAHPPFSTAFSISGIPPDCTILAETIVALGSIPIAEYKMPSSDALAEIVQHYILYHDAILLAHHGAVTVDSDLFKAYYKMETLEHAAKIQLASRMLGGEKSLPPEEVFELRRLREKFTAQTSHGAPDQNVSDKRSNREQTLISVSDVNSDEFVRNLVARIAEDVISKFNR